MSDFYDIYSPSEVEAEMALGAMQQARDHVAGVCGACPDSATGAGCPTCPTAAGYASITGINPLMFTPGAMSVTRPAPKRGSPVTWSPALRAAISQFRPGQAAVEAAARRFQRAAGPVVTEAEPGPVDVSYLPLNSPAAIAAGATFTIAQTSQTVFKPHRLNVPRNIADFFLIDNFSVGNVPLSAAAGQVPAASFATDATQANVRKVTANPGVQIIIQVQNIDGAPHRFLATLFGWSAQPEGCR